MAELSFKDYLKQSENFLTDSIKKKKELQEQQKEEVKKTITEKTSSNKRNSVAYASNLLSGMPDSTQVISENGKKIKPPETPRSKMVSRASLLV